MAQQRRLFRRTRQLQRELDTLKRQVAELKKAAESAGIRATLRVPPTAVLGEGCTIDPSVTLWSSEDRPIQIGDRTKIYRGGEIIGPVSIGSGCFINRDSYIRSNTTIGDNVLVGQFVRFVTDTHEIGPSAKRGGPNSWPPIAVGDGTWIGASVTILGGVTIGKGCIVAAGSVVVGDVPDNALVGGVPAKIIRILDA